MVRRLCRYVIRPPLAAGKLRVINEKTLRFTLKTPWSDGTTHLVLSPLLFFRLVDDALGVSLVEFCNFVSLDASSPGWPVVFHGKLTECSLMMVASSVSVTKL
jgi:hypothetical protein